jgi:hypothetical protein
MFQKYYIRFIATWKVIVFIGLSVGPERLLLLVVYIIQPVSVLLLDVYSWLPQHHGVNGFHKGETFVHNNNNNNSNNNNNEINKTTYLQVSWLG